MRTNDISPVVRCIYWLARFVILRLLGLVYLVAFLTAAKQIVPLIGAKGLLPVGQFLARVRKSLGSTQAGFVRRPSLVLVESFGRGPARDSVDRCGIVRRRSLRLVQCPRACGAVAALHVVRPCRAGLVWLRVGSAVAGDGIPRDFSLPAPGWPAVSAACAASRRPMAVPMADLPNHAGSWAHQDPGRFVLAGCDSPLLPL